jgi:tRNA (guanosine-2'-O-)-methyltransferase
MTPQRLARLRTLLDRRQPDLTVLMENVHKPHNFSAILRTCDATGVFEARAVVPEGRLRRSRPTSGGSHKWVRTRIFPALGEALAEVRASLQPFGEVQVLAAHQHERAIDYRAADYTRPTCILLGQEKHGVSAAAADDADGFILVPMHGLVASLNVSVATAVILYEAERQRAAAGLYAGPRLDPERYAHTLFEWAYPDVAAYCRKQQLPYPRLDDDGELIDPVPH